MNKTITILQILIIVLFVINLIFNIKIRSRQKRKKEISLIRQDYKENHDVVEAYRSSVEYFLYWYQVHLRQFIKDQSIVDYMEDTVNLIKEVKDKIKIVPKVK